MKKKCIFCGENLVDKTKEHIIPQWLIEHTGDKNRNINLGINYQTNEVREFSFNKFQVPACNDCNALFSKLESKNKNVLMKIFENEALTETDINILLDWFDKVRIGLWLQFYMLDKNILNIDPKFHISSRLGTQDRMLIIYKTSGNLTEGINFTGVNTPAFQLAPCCFTLRINNLYFFNVSKEYLFSRRIGFPFPETTSYLASVKYGSAGMREGIHRVIRPLLRRVKLLDTNRLEIYQPVFDTKLNKNITDMEIYNTDYVKKNCFDWENGKGKIFINDSNNRFLESEEEVKVPYTSLGLDELNILLANQVFSCQNILLKEVIDSSGFKNIDTDIRKYNQEIMLKVIDFNKALISRLRG